MRRKDREITDKDKILEIIGKCQCCRIALADGKSAYVVPVNFGYDNSRDAFYFHGAATGRKLDLIRQNGCAGFEMDTSHELVSSERACSYSFHYESIIGEGRVTVIEDTEEKRYGLDCIMEHMTGKGGWEYPDEAVRATAVIRLDVEKMCAKSNA